ncbi:peptide chain release factor 2 (bRF-2) [Propionicimonas paludicola]|uniref:Peptide chain release factor 2 n=1 Tax=Propionicimonas paludicola TaxID=185243 RepID=A0A2A9CPK1_9ACTN|nr:peptide chain release factor 2 [Propionicimonas paludicola]PFG16344.1 peptide chain release factor 2 (bRF-2) [Propionicimonas paludicola]
MTAADLQADLAVLDRTLQSIEAVLDPAAKKAEIAELAEQAAAPDLWDDQDNAQAVTSKLSRLQAEVDRITALRGRVDDLGVLIELAVEEDDPATLSEAQRDLKGLSADIEALEIRTLLAGEYDQRDALVTIRAEAGGVDAADFASMLLRMYLRWAERHGYATEVYDTSFAEEAGIKSATFTVKEPFAYGMLSVEQGTHRLVRISPFDNQGRRQTSFAGVDVLPVTEETDHIDVPEADIRVDVFRSSGPGGQSVNTTDSAVRITHLPTGLVVSCQNEKSQLQNKAAALRVLQSRLLERARAEKEAEMRGLKGDAGNSWGSQMRSYVLHPYQMVKDLRTEHEVGNPDAVFDGDIDAFIDAGVRWRRQQGER